MQTETTGFKSARDVIADAIASVCSDGNSDCKRVAEDVIMALGQAGYEIVPVDEELSDGEESQTTDLAAALEHLGNVLEILADLHEDDRCQALDDALAFYNQRCPDQRVEPVPGFRTRLVHSGPIDLILPSVRSDP